MVLAQLRRLLPFVRPYRRAYALGFAALVVAVALRLWIPRLVGGALDDLQVALDAEATGFERERAQQLLIAAVLWIVGAALAGALVRTFSRFAILGTCRRVVHDLRTHLFDHLTRLAPSFFLKHSSGQLLSRALNDAQNVQGLTGPVFLYISETAILFAIGFGALVSIDPVMTFCALAPFPFFVWRARVLAKHIQDGSRAGQEALGELSERVGESLGASLVIKTMALEGFERARFEKRCDDYRQLMLNVARARAQLMPMMLALAGISIVVTLALGAPRVRSGALEIGDLAAFLISLQLLAAPTGTLGFVISSLQRGAVALQRIFQVIDEEPTITAPAGGGESLGELRGAIEVRGLHVSRPLHVSQPQHTAEADAPAGEREVLRDLSFDLPAGSTLGVVGRTGSGKTTLVLALARLLEVDPGTLLLDGRDVTELDPRDVRRQIGYVPQDPFLFSASLRENLMLGRPDATEEELQAALSISQLEKDLPQLPEGLETTVGERGVNLSGGQRQRAALARAVLMRPGVLILDDTLSAVDTETAAQILAGLEPVMAERTTVIVAHRLSTLKHADRILVLDEGRLAESGRHDELLAAGGVYAALWEAQERGLERDPAEPAAEGLA
ncbi:MAG: ABC transporter ATP-binding protein [Planctomycetota bacterium]